MSKWSEVRLGELIDVNPETLAVSKYNGKIQYIDISSVNCGQLDGYTEYDIVDAPSRARRIIRNNDIIYSTVRPNLRAYYYVKNCPDNAICSTGFAVLRAKENVDSRFIYSLVTENSFVDYLSLVAKGSAYPAVDTADFKKSKVTVPDLPTQKRIADILFAYDDLIENNNRRIALLEKAAQELYKEWFVRFRFPGYENTKFEGDIPKGWETRRLGDVLDIKRGGSPRPIQDFLTNDGLKWLKISDATKSSNPFVFNIEESIKEEGLRKTVYLKAGSLVLSNSATPGLPRILAIDTCIHDGWLYFTNQNLSNEFLFLFFNHIRPNLVNKGNGAVFTNLKTDILKKYLFARPEERVLQQFDNAIKPIFNQIYTITKQNVNLTMQRDLLLPRLMSGKLEV